MNKADNLIGVEADEQRAFNQSLVENDDIKRIKT